MGLQGMRRIKQKKKKKNVGEKLSRIGGWWSEIKTHQSGALFVLSRARTPRLVRPVVGALTRTRGGGEQSGRSASRAEKLCPGEDGKGWKEEFKRDGDEEEQTLTRAGFPPFSFIFHSSAVVRAREGARGQVR